MSLWKNIHNRRKSGKRMRKPGEKGAPTQDALDRARGEGKGFQPAMMLNPKTKAEIIANRKKKMKESTIAYGKAMVKKQRDQKKAMISKKDKKTLGNLAKLMAKQPKRKTEDTTTADAGIPHDTKDMGPKLKTKVMFDRRVSPKKKPKLLKQFRKYLEDNGVI